MLKPSDVIFILCHGEIREATIQQVRVAITKGKPSQTDFYGHSTYLYLEL